MTIKALISGIFFLFFLFVFVASVREKNWLASILWFIPLSIFIVFWAIVLIPKL